jgi:hypothetical protein
MFSAIFALDGISRVFRWKKKSHATIAWLLSWSLCQETGSLPNRCVHQPSDSEMPPHQLPQKPHFSSVTSLSAGLVTVCKPDLTISPIVQFTYVVHPAKTATEREHQ